MNIRLMFQTDIEKINNAFAAQGWERREIVLQNYFLEQTNGERFVFIAEETNEVLGYVTLLPQAKEGPFRAAELPEIADFNIFEKYQRQGVGHQLLAAAEEKAKTFSSVVTLGVGLHPGYGAAQRLYIKSGYLPDGSGIWFENQNLAMGAPCRNNDDLVLYLSKELY